ncbi:hypothetical protein KJ359_011617 [Pestalotiopsis sp. 9143b]|nr:hypothetical protein KJ359_011617 [Pestalotiopsis sp. 9143b]
MLAHHSVHAYATQTPRDGWGYYQMRPRQAERLCLFIQAIIHNIHNIHRSRAARRWKPQARLSALHEFDASMTGPRVIFDMATKAASAREFTAACDKLNRLVNADLSLLDSPKAPTTLYWQFLGQRPRGCSDLWWPPFLEGGGRSEVIEGCRFDFDDLQKHVIIFSHFPIMLSWSHPDMVAVKVEDNPWPEHMRSGGVGAPEK